MNKHYFFVPKIRGWFRSIAPQTIRLTKVHFDFFSTTLISRKASGAALIVLLWLIPACGPDTPAATGDNSTGKTNPDGKAVYRRHCVTCHGADGTLGLNGAGDLTKSVLPLDVRIIQITKGKNLMTPFEGILSPEEIRAVAAYSETLKK